MLKVPYFKQDNNYSCGAAALQMVLRFYGEIYSEKHLAEVLGSNKDFGTSHQAMIDFVRKDGFHVHEADFASHDDLKEFLSKNIPVIVNFLEPESNEGHYAVVIGCEVGHIFLNDPWDGKGFKLTIEAFEKRWINGAGTSTHWLMAILPKHFQHVAKN
ncbi:MAG: cysteine peptidase family C39 domain-containing protein [Candidatus Paceibacterota bacterium]|jgi:predicted double-glycine peptidase